MRSLRKITGSCSAEWLASFRFFAPAKGRGRLLRRPLRRLREFLLVAVLVLSALVSSQRAASEASGATRNCNGLLVFASNRAQNVNPEIYAFRLAGRSGSNVSRSLGSDSDPQPSPNGRLLAFFSDRGPWPIWISNIDGSHPHPVRVSELAGRQLAWSPDSTKVALQTFTNGNDVTIVDAATGAATTIGTGFHPVWSPDGSLIAIEDPRNGNGVGLLYVERPDGFGRRRLAGSFEETPLPAVWSPDGTRLLVPGLMPSVVPISGAAAVTLSDSHFYGVAWSLDGTRILGSRSNQAGVFDLGVWSIAADGSDLRQVTDTNGRVAGPNSFSPDRRWAILVGDSDSLVVLVDLTTGEARDLGPWSSGNEPRSFDPIWAPDSKHLAYWNGGRVDVVDTATGQRQSLVKDAFHDDDPAWQIDSGGLLATTIDTSGNSDIYLSRPNGSGLRAVVKDAVPEGGPAWSPDGKRLAFVRYDRTPSLLISDLRGRTRSLFRFKSRTRGTDLGPPSWSPDGAKIAVATNLGVLVIDTRTAQARYLHRSTGSATDSNPAWSPDGRELAFAQASPNFQSGFIEIKRINREGAWHAPIGWFTFPSGDTEPGNLRTLAWSPHGQRLAYARTAYGAPTDDPGDVLSDIRILDTGTHKITQTITDAGAWGFGWSPDSRYLVQGGFDTQITTPAGKHVVTLKQLRAIDPSWQPLC